MARRLCDDTAVAKLDGYLFECDRELAFLLGQLVGRGVAVDAAAVREEFLAWFEETEIRLTPNHTLTIRNAER